MRDVGALDEKTLAPRYAYDVAPAMAAVRESCDRLYSHLSACVGAIRNARRAGR